MTEFKGCDSPFREATVESVRIVSYNIENMHRMFSHGALLDSARERGQAIARTVDGLAPHILGIVEASDRESHHQILLTQPALKGRGYRIGKSKHRRMCQDLAFWYREPVELVTLDEAVHLYDEWTDDIDGDGIREVFGFDDRAPLEARFRIRGQEILVILLALKSKGVHSLQDFHGYQKRALANRKRLLAQARKLRERLDGLMVSEPDLPLVVMGDFNDDPGTDSYERQLGASAVETVMGSVFAPELILHNTLWHMMSTPALRRELWTLSFPDALVRRNEEHRAWVDHLLVSPNLRSGKSRLRLRENSGAVAPKDDCAHRASDHFPVCCDLELN